jgi:hypothetical protein
VSSANDQTSSAPGAGAPLPAAPRLVCYAVNEFVPKIVAARPERDWMDAQPNRHPYRCLPLAVANAYGWHLLCPAPIEIDWNGGPGADDLKIRALKPMGRLVETFCRSVFCFGIVTMHINYIFQTDPGWDLLATGPANSPKDNAYPLTGIIETSWLPYPFTMNWQVLRPGRVSFEEDEPFCSIVPIQKNAVLECRPEIRPLSDDPELEAQAKAWRTERFHFNARFYSGDPEARRQGWSKRYFLGERMDGTPVDGHVNKLRLKEPLDRSK